MRVPSAQQQVPSAGAQQRHGVGQLAGGTGQLARQTLCLACSRSATTWDGGVWQRQRLQLGRQACSTAAGARSLCPLGTRSTRALPSSARLLGWASHVCHVWPWNASAWTRCLPARAVVHDTFAQFSHRLSLLSFLQALEREGVDTLFAYPGGASMEIHQALTRSDSIRNILCRHEQVRAGCCLLARGRFALFLAQQAPVPTAASVTFCAAASRWARALCSVLAAAAAAVALAAAHDALAQPGLAA